MPRKNADAEPGFEPSLERLETLVAEMENGELPLEQMIARFEEGSRLVKYCSGKLQEVERRIEQLIRQGEETVAVPFAPAEDQSPPTAGG